MDKAKKSKAEKLQVRLDKLLQDKGKKQTAFDKAQQELDAVTKEIDSVKFKLFDILQSGSDDSAFSSWAKRRINEKGENDNSVKADKPEMSVLQNQRPQEGQNQPPHVPQSQNHQNRHNGN